MSEKYINIDTGDNRIVAWGYLIKKKNRRDILSLHIRIPGLLHTIPLSNGAKIVCETASFQIHDVRVKI